MLLLVIASAMIATIQLIGSGGEERFLTVFAQVDRGLRVGDHEENRHLQAQQQRVIVPHHHRPVPQFKMTGRSGAIEYLQRLAVGRLLFLG